jgi:hypothetical protein
MPTLPTPGGDYDSWGTELNEFLEVVHGDDGRLIVGTVDNPHGLMPAPDATVASWNDGQASAPATDTSYLTPVLYIERHSDSAVGPEAGYANGYLAAPIEVDVFVYENDGQSHNGVTARIFADSPVPFGSAPLVGFTAQAECHASGTDRNRDLFGANLAVLTSAGDGLAPGNFMGIEVDLVAGVPMDTFVRPGVAGNQRYVGYMAQSSENACNSGLWVTSYDGVNNNAGPGWYMGVQAEAWFYAWGGYFRNTRNAVDAGGVYIETTYGATGTSILECAVQTNTNFIVDCDLNNPVWLRIGGGLVNLTQQTAGAIVGGFTAGAGTAMKNDSTSTGDTGSAAYTFGDVVRALKNLGFLDG